jgi:uncharacterized Fe-S radical SAM superfamily protein PflX
VCVCAIVCEGERERERRGKCEIDVHRYMQRMYPNRENPTFVNMSSGMILFVQIRTYMYVL